MLFFGDCAFFLAVICSLILSFASSCWTCYAFEYTKLSKLKFKCFGSFFKISRLNEKYESIRLLNLLCYFAEVVLLSSQLFVHSFLVLHQVTELFMHLNIPNYQNWNSSVLGHFFEISSLNEKYESIRLLNLLCYFAEVVLLSSQLFVHSFLVLHQVTEVMPFEYTKFKIEIQACYWTCYGFFPRSYLFMIFFHQFV